MNFSDFTKLPSVREHFGAVKAPLESLLTDFLVETADGSTGSSEQAQAEVGAIKAIAHVIKIVRAVEGDGKKAPKPFTLKPLRRYTGDKQPVEDSKPK